MNSEGETARLKSLAEYNILDSEQELAYDDLTRLAAEICGVPIAMITIIDEHRQWTKSKVGVDLVEVDRSLSFCNHTIQQRELLVVSDTRDDSRFADNPFVKGNPNVRFYAGYPIVSREGEGLGSLCVVDTQPKELTEGQKVALAALGRQVTAQLELRRRLRENEESLGRQRAAENERDRFFQATVDLLTIHKLGETTYRQMNDSWERTLGYSVEELCSASFLEFVHPDDIEPSRLVLGGLAHGVDVLGFRNRYRHRNGSWKWLEWQAFAPPPGEELVYAVARDVTSQVESAEKLRQKTQELETVFNVFPDFFFQLNQDGVILDYHGGHAGGGPFSHDCVGRHLHDILPGEVTGRLKKAREEARHSQMLQQVEFSYADDQGEHSFEVRILPDDGRSLIVVIRDITDRALADRAQLEAKQVAESASRSKSEFLASMSHELRTPLNAVLNISESLEEEVYGTVNDKQRHSLQTISESGRHLLGLINDILDLSKIEAGKLELSLSRVVVQPLCESSLRLVREQSQIKSQEIFLSISPAVPVAIQADDRKLKQVLVNLLSNAIKFTPDGGRVGLEVAMFEEMVAFTVWDSGIGISKDDLKKLFQPFVQLDSKLSRQYAGTGLGLSLAQRLTNLHGGEIEVESIPGRGSRFTAFVPAGSSKIDVAIQRAKTKRLAKILDYGKGPRVLLVEDTEANRECIGDYLIAKGFRLQFAENGEQAIEIVSREIPDIILMDIQMSGMDGFEAIRRLRENPNLAKTPVIALTALAMEGDSERCLAAGATHYLSKPVALKELVITLHAVLDETNPGARKALS
jgi:PAS domain S-box-containing protein